jgi:hypothetical protein
VATAVLDPGIGAKRLVGYVVAAGVTPAAVVAHCRSLLVPAMVPSAIVALDAFPLLPNGKIDMNGLPLPDWGSLQEEEVEYVEPANETERRIHDLWLEVRGCRRGTLKSERHASCVVCVVVCTHGLSVCAGTWRMRVLRCRVWARPYFASPYPCGQLCVVHLSPPYSPLAMPIPRSRASGPSLSGPGPQGAGFFHRGFPYRGRHLHAGQWAFA